MMRRWNGFPRKKWTASCFARWTAASCRNIFISPHSKSRSWSCFLTAGGPKHLEDRALHTQYFHFVFHDPLSFAVVRYYAANIFYVSVNQAICVANTLQYLLAEIVSCQTALQFCSHRRPLFARITPWSTSI